jgi:hypothetical protein
METPKLRLSLLPNSLAVSRLPAGEGIPGWAQNGDFYSVSSAAAEVSVISASQYVPDGVRASHGWRAIKIEGPLDLDLVGILVSVAVPLAQAGVGILPVGTFDTDYILVRDRQLLQALRALRATGFEIQE